MDKATDIAFLDAKRAHLREILRANAPLIVAYSGGVDSAFLLAETRRELGDRFLGVIADSPSLPRQSLADAVALARAIGAPVEVVKTLELNNPDYAANPPNRCYFCKAELFQTLDTLARSRGYPAIAYGENADDMQHERPGRAAATEFHVLAPLRDAGLTKAEIRLLSRDIGLPTADAPAQPCLSSRIPWGTPVTTDALAMVERAEEHIRSLGFRVFRVRHVVKHDNPPAALVQIALAELPLAAPVQTEIEIGVREAGYASVQIDPGGYRGPSL
ncbi:MAG: ATP-dependent sacrificial sulfur transferase LarE [Chthoniobacteraceae bacterium]